MLCMLPVSFSVFLLQHYNTRRSDFVDNMIFAHNGHAKKYTAKNRIGVVM